MALLLHEQNFDDQNFKALIAKTRRGKCTPFIGAGVSPHPNATQIANAWAKEIDYPMSNADDPARVNPCEADFFRNHCVEGLSSLGWLIQADGR